jgi:amino acid permease
MLKDNKVIFHRGIFKPTVTLADAVFMITGMTIGAGILALPYAVAMVGLIPGVAYIITLGFIMLFLNLMIGEIAIRTKEQYQLDGFIGKYLGKPYQYFFSLLFLLSSFGSLLVYVIGEGVSLSAIFGGSEVLWSVIFWSVGSFFIWGGLQKVKSVDKIIGAVVVATITGISFYLFPRFEVQQLSYFSSSHIFFPIGVILFALHASPAIVEAHALLPDRERTFRKALLIGTLVPVVLYVLFTIAVVGFTGQNTTEVATVGLGRSLGPIAIVVANIFAILAMSTGFMSLGTALKEALVWDHKFPEKFALFLVISVPLALFLLGVRSFILTLDVVGTVCIASEAILLSLSYLKARKGSDAVPEHYFSHEHPWLLSFPVIAIFGSLLLFSIYRFFIR